MTEMRRRERERQGRRGKDDEEHMEEGNCTEGKVIKEITKTGKQKRLTKT